MKEEIMQIVRQRLLAPKIYEMTLTGELVRQMETPGQFLHLRLPQKDHLLRRPISISQIDRKKKECRIIYRIKGSGTRLFSQMRAGETIDVMGPLGNGFDLSKIKAEEVVYIVGGGIGIPPLYELSRQLVEKKARPVHFLGFATKEAVFYQQEFEKLGQTYLATDDGSLAVKGNVSQLFDLENHPPKAVFACGPGGLLKACKKIFLSATDNVQLSLEERMACGIGVCYGCVVPTADGKNKKVCEDGPVFQAREVVIG